MENTLLVEEREPFGDIFEYREDFVEAEEVYSGEFAGAEYSYAVGFAESGRGEIFRSSPLSVRDERMQTSAVSAPTTMSATSRTG